MRRFVSMVLSLAVLMVLATQAWAITIVKPTPPPGGQITAVTDGQNTTLNNSGHYAVAQGTGANYVWAVNPPAAATIQNVLANGHTVRFMSSRQWAVQNNYTYYTITVTDLGDASQASITVWPISLDFVEGYTKDRVVESMSVGESGNYERVIKVECKGQQAIFDLASRAYHVQQGSPPNQQTGAGTITATKFDNNAQWVAGDSCSPPPGVQPPYGVWRFIPPSGVSASWNPATQAGTIHTISITGDILSSWWDDIEIDVGIKQYPYILNCADGLGASMTYTVAEVDVVVRSMDENEEEGEGDYVLMEKGEANGKDAILCNINRVKPDDCDGYQVRTQVLDTGENEVNRVELLTFENGEWQVWSTPRDVDANGDLSFTFTTRAKSKSTDKNDTRIRAKLMADGAEAGGETCRDFAYLTVLEAEVVSPVKEGDGSSITTPVSGTPQSGNEFTFSDAATGAFQLMWRMKILPNTQDVQEDLNGRMSFDMFSIGDSTPTWDDDQEIVYDSSSTEWRSRVTWTGLPTNNSAFGEKACIAQLSSTHGGSLNAVVTRTVEVFFDRDATNHPSGTAGDPNWFYYWGQVYVNSNVAYDGSWAGEMKTPGMLDWSYTTAQSKSAIVVGTQNPGSGQDYGVGEFFSGIDYHIVGIIHEETHVQRISTADALVPVAAGTCFRYGWSYNSPTTVNHWNKGSDGQWGVAGTDDDTNGTTDDAATTPPFEPGNGDDVRLSGTGREWYWATSWSLPSPDLAYWPEESEAVNAADAAVDEHDYAGQDWGNPGKNHRTTNDWED